MLDQQTMVNFLNKDYCLWVGAGVGRHISSLGTYKTATWLDLVSLLEKRAGVFCPASFEKDFPKRIEIALRVIGRRSFQKLVRESVLDPIVKSIMQWLILNIDLFFENKKIIIPKEIKALATLAARANPIVNFNVETLSSSIIACFGGNYSIKAFHRPISGSVERRFWSKGQSDGKSYSRSIIHPHGAVDITGLCVVSDSEYKSLNGTLSMQVAVNSAFMNNLIIVGFSMNDYYLREKVSIFRDQINSIIWVSDYLSDDDKEWIWKNNIKVFKVNSYDEFWSGILGNLSKNEESSYEDSWLGLLFTIINLAKNEKNHLRFMEMSREMDKKYGFRDLVDDTDYLIMARNSGESEEMFPLMPISEILEVENKLHKIGWLNHFEWNK